MKNAVSSTCGDSTCVKNLKNRLTIVPEDIQRVITQLALLHVLLDRIKCFLGGNLHFGSGILADLDHSVDNVAALVSPRRNAVSNDVRKSNLALQ